MRFRSSVVLVSLRKASVSVSNGRGSTSFRPPSVGRYRATGRYLGSGISAPDDTGTARLSVHGPLSD